MHRHYSDCGSHPLFGWLGILPAIGILIGVFEETGFKAAGAINAISYILWSIWMIAFGIALLLNCDIFSTLLITFSHTPVQRMAFKHKYRQ